MESTNLIALYSVQQASGMESRWYTSRQQAEAQYQAWEAKVQQEFEAGQCVESRLESTPEGFAHEYWVIPSHARPELSEHAPGSLKGERPQGIPPWAWGNPALQRPRR